MDSCDAAKQMRSKMRDRHPGQNKESGVVGQQMAVTFPRLCRPAEEGVAAVDGVWRRGKGEAGNQSVAGIGQILQMFADRLRIAQIVILPDQGVEQLFFRRPSDLAQFDGAKIAQGRAVIGEGWKELDSLPEFFFFSVIVIVDSKPRWQGYELLSFKLE